MTEHQDNAGEVVSGAVRVALTAAGQLAEQAARRREADLREAERESAARVATVRSQLAAERQLALRSVRDVVQRGDVATVDEVMRAWEQARSWDDPTMGLERAYLEEHIRERFGVDASSFVQDRSGAEEATAAAMVARDAERQADDAHQRIELQCGAVVLQADLSSASSDPEAVAARALAAQSHPTPAGYAAWRPRATPAARMGRGRRAAAAEVQGPGR